MALLLFIAAGTILLLFYPIIEYFVDSKKLRRFPSPGIAGFSDLWALRYH